MTKSVRWRCHFYGEQLGITFDGLHEGGWESCWGESIDDCQAADESGDNFHHFGQWFTHGQNMISARQLQMVLLWVISIELDGWSSVFCRVVFCIRTLFLYCTYVKLPSMCVSVFPLKFGTYEHIYDIFTSLFSLLCFEEKELHLHKVYSILK